MSPFENELETRRSIVPLELQDQTWPGHQLLRKNEFLHVHCGITNTVASPTLWHHQYSCYMYIHCGITNTVASPRQLLHILSF